MGSNKLVSSTYDYVKEEMASDKTGHDWWHVSRVLKLARHIAESEQQVNTTVLELGALLHDIADWKFNEGDITAGPNAVREWLSSLEASTETTEAVAYIVEHISYRGGTNKHKMKTIEGKIVQDADRLDAIGAIGIARTFTFGGFRHREMYNPDHRPQTHLTFDSYRSSISDNTTINHFYEKLLLLKDGMHTDTAKLIAQNRHKVMEDFLNEFYTEWEGKR
jgi:uncharacterized protein